MEESRRWGIVQATEGDREATCLEDCSSFESVATDVQQHKSTVRIKVFIYPPIPAATDHDVPHKTRVLSASRYPHGGICILIINYE